MRIAAALSAEQNLNLASKPSTVEITAGVCEKLPSYLNVFLVYEIAARSLTPYI